MSKDWKWGDDSTKECTVFPTVSAVAVYTNPHGNIVIRQEGYAGEDDSVIIIPRSHVASVIRALQAESEQEAA